MEPLRNRFVNVRRLAAVDMHGLNGTVLRRRLIIAEFVLSALAGIGIGLFLLFSTPDAVGIVLGLYAIGVGANYVPAAIHALSLRSPARLKAELAGADVESELRHYTAAQLWVFVPLLFVWLAVAQR